MPYGRAYDIPCKREGKRFRLEWRRSARASRRVLPREKSASARFLSCSPCTCIDLSQCSPKLLLRFTRAPLQQRCFLAARPRVSRRAGLFLSPASRLQHAPPWPPPLLKNLDRARVRRHWSTYRSVGVTAGYVISPMHTHTHLELIKDVRIYSTQASAAFPENTLASFEAAIKDGAEGIETGTLPRPA